MVQGTPPPGWWVPPVYSIVEQGLSPMGDAVAGADRRREELAQQIGRFPVQETTLIEPPR